MSFNRFLKPMTTLVDMLHNIEVKSKEFWLICGKWA